MKRAGDDAWTGFSNVNRAGTDPAWVKDIQVVPFP